MRLKTTKKLEMERRKILFKITPNKKVDDIKKNPILTNISTPTKLQKFPLEGVGKYMDNLKFMYLYCQNNKEARKELEIMISDHKTLNDPFQRFSIYYDFDIINQVVKANDTDLYLKLMKEWNGLKSGRYERPEIPPHSLPEIDSGKRNIYQFGFMTKAIHVGRGGKEGNNAFYQLEQRIFTEDFIEPEDFLEINPSIDIIKLILADPDNNDMFDGFNDILKSIYVLIRNGEYQTLTAKINKNGDTLLKKMADDMSYGFNRYHYLALGNEIPSRVNRFGLAKKPYTNKAITPMHVACINPDPTMLKKFITINSDYSVADKENRKLMHYAAANQSDSVIKFLIAKGAPVNEKDVKGMTPFMIACKLGRIDNILALMKSIKDSKLNEEDEDYEIMKKSMDCVNTYGPKRNFPLHYAVLSESISCVKTLIENAENIEIDCRNNDNETPLFIACQKGYYEIAEYLIDKGASMLDPKGQKKNALIRASKNGHIHIVSLVLRKGVHPDCPDSSGSTALHYAAAFGWIHIVKLLINSGATIDIENEWNTTPVILAMLKNRFGVMDYLLKQKDGNQELIDEEGQTIAIKFCNDFNLDTSSQLKYMDKITKIDYSKLDGKGNSAMHQLSFHYLLPEAFYTVYKAKYKNVNKKAELNQISKNK